MAFACSGWGSGATTNILWRFDICRGAGRQTHYWALRQQAQRDLRSTEKGVAGRACPVGGQAVAVVALLWWWGVVFDLWIVVASI